jgi:cytochrome c peroxidase
LLLFVSCQNPEKPKENESKVINLSVHDALPKEVKVPEDNLPSYEKIELGRLLFYDPILSGNKDVACASCHHPNNGYAEYKDISIGVNGKGLSSKRTFNQPNDIPFVKRNAHTVLNTAFNGMNIYNKYSPEDAPMFWDDRAKSLEKQAIEPILAMEEMRGNRIPKTEIMATVIDRLNKTPGYAALFQAVFQEANSINEINIGKAIAAFERTLNTTDTRFDQYMRGDKKGYFIIRTRRISIIQ